MSDIEQHAVQLVEYVSHRRIAGVLGGLAVEAAFTDQAGGSLLLRGNIELALRIGVGQFDEHHLRPFKIVADGHQQHALAGLWIGDGGDLGAGPLGYLRIELRIMPAGHECGNQKARHGRGGRSPAPLERRKPAPASGNAMLNAPPYFGAILGAGIRNGQRVDHIQYALQGAIKVAATGALFQMQLGGKGIALFAVVMQNQLFFSQVIHLAVLTKLWGSQSWLQPAFSRLSPTFNRLSPGPKARAWSQKAA